MNYRYFDINETYWDYIVDSMKEDGLIGKNWLISPKGIGFVFDDKINDVIYQLALDNEL